jgi:hypothetical protein
VLRKDERIKNAGQRPFGTKGEIQKSRQDAGVTRELQNNAAMVSFPLRRNASGCLGHRQEWLCY